MKKALYLILAVLALYSCGQNKSEEKESGNRTIETAGNESSALEKKPNQLPKNTTRTIEKDTVPTHIFKTGETLWDLCRTYYGNRHYSSIIAMYNEIENVESIEHGTAIKIPRLEKLLRDPKLKLEPIQSEIGKMLEARQLFMKHEKSLSQLREGVEGRTPIVLPDSVKRDVQRATMLIDESIKYLGKIDSDSVDVPVKTIGQLKSIKANLTNLAQGNHDGPYGYDLDMFHQRLIRAINSSIAWVQKNYE